MGLPVCEEQWKPIQGYDGRYCISNHGRVYSHLSKRVLKNSKTNNGYLTVELFDDNHKSKRHLVHRLVGETFLDNPNKYPCINHKDENRSNNFVDNLEWCTHKYNSNYGTCIEKRVANTDYSKPFYKEHALENSMKRRVKVSQYSVDGELLNVYESGADASRETGISHSHILECCAGKRCKTVGGFVWKYTERSDDLLVSRS